MTDSVEVTSYIAARPDTAAFAPVTGIKFRGVCWGMCVVVVAAEGDLLSNTKHLLSLCHFPFETQPIFYCVDSVSAFFPRIVGATNGNFPNKCETCATRLRARWNGKGGLGCWITRMPRPAREGPIGTIEINELSFLVLRTEG